MKEDELKNSSTNSNAHTHNPELNEAGLEKTYGDKISTVDEHGKRKWQYVFKPAGKFYNWRTALSFVYLILFFGLPFLRMNGNPLFQFNILEAKFIFFGRAFFPQDFILFGIGMLIFLLFVVVFTLIYGRVFCGWACPQTIFMEMVFRKIEYFIEGDANKQRIADGKPWTTELYIRKAIKHIVFFALSFIIANTFLSYIIGTDELFKIMREPLSQHVGGFFAIIIFTFVFYAVYAFVREIVCTVICPYGRLQSVLTDRNTILVAYDHLRGEPRAKGRKDGAGDCIDCSMCVKVCPTGIDIRNGTQLECVNCTACIDACNTIMRKVNKPEDLIKYASANQVSTGEKFRFTYRVKAYSFVLLLLVGLLVILLATRSMIDATVLRVPGQVLQENADGTISNLYRIKLVNKSNEAQPYHLELIDKDAKIEYVGNKLDTLRGASLAEETFFIKVKIDKITKRKETYKVNVMSGQKIIDTKKAIFIGQY